MQVGDLIKFPATNYTAIILEFTEDNSVRILITQDVNFKNPTWMTVPQLERCGEIVNSAQGNTQSSSR